MTPPCFGNLLAALPDASDDEAFEGLLQLDGVRVERIVSRGQASPEGFWYEPTHHEFVIVIRGQGELEFGDGTARVLTPGDWCLLPAGCRHRVVSTDRDSETVWLAVHWGEGA